MEKGRGTHREVGKKGGRGKKLNGERDANRKMTGECSRKVR